MMPGTKIYLFINSKHADGDVEAIAVAEDGRVLSGHLSSNIEWAKRDMMDRPSKHVTYTEKCPDGYELVWVDDKLEIESLVKRWNGSE